MIWQGVTQYNVIHPKKSMIPSTIIMSSRWQHSFPMSSSHSPRSLISHLVQVLEDHEITLFSGGSRGDPGVQRNLALFLPADVKNFRHNNIHDHKINANTSYFFLKDSQKFHKLRKTAVSLTLALCGQCAWALFRLGKAGNADLLSEMGVISGIFGALCTSEFLGNTLSQILDQPPHLMVWMVKL